MINTLGYYNKHAKEYYDGTVNANIYDCYTRFLRYVKRKAYILDAGCGSGRDSKYFLSKGYSVKAIDGSKELCKLASSNIGQEVECVDFMNLSYTDVFDAVWACASLLHVNKKDLNKVVSNLHKALKNDGVLYASFKYGNTDRIQGERYFNDLNEDLIKKLFISFDIKEVWLSDDVRPGRDDKWINIVAKKKKKTIRVVAAIVEKDEEILIARRLSGEFAGLWEFPGGKYEFGETGEQAIKREIEEEFEAEIEVKELICTIRHRYSSFNLIMDCFICELCSDQFRLHDHSSYQWIAPTVRGIKWVPADKKVIKAYKEKLGI